MELKLGLPLSLILVNALFCIRFKTWKAYQNLTPVASARAYIAGRRGAKMIDIYRSAGLLLILVTVAHGQTAPKLSAYCTRQEFNQLNCLEPRAYIDNQGVQWQFDGEIIWMNHKKYAVVTGPAAKTGNENKLVSSAGYSDGDTALVDQFVWRSNQSSKVEQFVFDNWYWIALGCVAIFLFLQFGGGRESNDTIE